jgi:hypothetical protein
MDFFNYTHTIKSKIKSINKFDIYFNEDTALLPSTYMSIELKVNEAVLTDTPW